MRIVCFHPALAPYRLHFFNILAECTNFHLVLLQRNLYSQKFDQKSLLSKLKAEYEYLETGCRIFRRNIRFGFGHIIDRIKPQIVIGYEASQTTLSLLLYRFLRPKCGIKIWTIMDDSPELVNSRSGLRRIVRDFVLRHVDLVIVPSDEAKNAYCAHIPSIPIPRYAIVPIVQDTVEMRKNADVVYAAGARWRSANIPAGWKHVLLFVGRLAPEKNLAWLIKQIMWLDGRWGLVIVGDGDGQACLLTLVNDLGLNGRVIFAGRQEGTALYSAMSMADALVLCSSSEPYGAVVSEALQWGTPCIVSRNCGASVLVESGKNGCVFEYNDEDGFRQSLARLPSRCKVSILRVDLRKALHDLLERASSVYGFAQQ